MSKLITIKVSSCAECLYHYNSASGHNYCIHGAGYISLHETKTEQGPYKLNQSIPDDCPLPEDGETL